jgi:hypothetical protein
MRRAFKSHTTRLGKKGAFACKLEHCKNCQKHDMSLVREVSAMVGCADDAKAARCSGDVDGVASWWGDVIQLSYL